MEMNLNKYYYLSSSLRGYADSSAKLIQILFLKSIIDDTNKYKNLNVNNMKILFDFQKLFNENQLTEEHLYKTFKAVEEANCLNNNELTSGISLFRFYFEKTNQKRINECLKEYEFEADFNSRRNMFLELLNQIAIGSGKHMSESICSPSIYRIASSILKVNENDHVLNTFAGYSAFILNQKDFKKAYAYEKSIEVITTTYMLKIMCGLDNYEVELSDFYLNDDTNVKYNKIFTDGPLGSKLKGEYESNEGDILNITKTYELLDDNGVAVILAPNRILFGGSKQFCNLRKSLVDIGLKAIVALPNNVIYGTAVPINLFVIQKGYSGNVLLINASEDMFESTKILRVIKEKNSDFISKLIDNSEEIAGVSLSVDSQKLFGDGTNPVFIQKFFDVVEEKVYRHIKEIDKEIDEVLKEIILLNK